MQDVDLSRLAAEALGELCALPSRHVGSAGNRVASDAIARRWRQAGLEVRTSAFGCIAWDEAGAELEVNGEPFDVRPSPYSLAADASAPLVAASSLDELEQLPANGRLLLLHGSLAGEQLMPKRFPFYRPPRHQAILRALERTRPAAIVAATGRDPSLAGGISPFPLFEDGDFDVPSVYLAESDGARLAGLVGRPGRLRIRAERRAASGANVAGRVAACAGSDRGRQVTCFAHLDAKRGTPGAIDNASGVVTLLLLGALLAERAPSVTVELVALNGEDDYAVPGERLYLEENARSFPRMLLGINVDGVGYREGRTAYSLYGCPGPLARTIRSTLACRDDLVEGPPWYQGDHHLFLREHRPALAWTSERVGKLLSSVIHTPADRPELVDPDRLVALARTLADLIDAVAGAAGSAPSAP